MQEINEKILEEIVHRLLSEATPQKIVLFGSRNRRDAHPDSDYDLLIVEQSELPRYKRAAKYRRALRGLHIAKDIVVWTPEEIKAWRSVPNAFITRILREGRVLYEG